MDSIVSGLNFREIGAFNSREVAIFICTVILVVFCFYDKKVRPSLFRVFKAIFERKLIVIYGISIFYSIFPIIYFCYLGLWNVSLIKDAVFWLLFSATPILFELNKANGGFFEKIFFDNLKFSLVVEFITSQYTFNVFVEILILVFGVLIGGAVVFSEREKKYEDIRGILKVISHLMKWIILSISIYFFFKEIERYITVDKFKEFSLPIILGIWFIPFLYILHIYMNYESVFVALNSSIKNRKINKYAKTKAIFNFGFNIASLKRWKDSLFITEPTTREDVLISFLDLKKLQLIEKNPPKVDISKGWSPYEAKKILINEGVNMSYYKKVEVTYGNHLLLI